MDANQLASDHKIIASERNLTDEEFLKNMSQSDSLNDHEPDTTCGMCHHMFLMAEVAREMIAAGDNKDAISKWAATVDHRWRESKFVQLWNQAVVENKDPNEVFKERGWEP